MLLGKRDNVGISYPYVAEIQVSGKVRGFALLSYEPGIRFCYLDYLRKKRIVKRREQPCDPYA